MTTSAILHLFPFSEGQDKALLKDPRVGLGGGGGCLGPWPALADPPTQVSSGKNEIYQTGRKFETDFRYTVWGALTGGGGFLEQQPGPDTRRGNKAYLKSARRMNLVQVLKGCPSLFTALGGQGGVAPDTVLQSVLILRRREEVDGVVHPPDLGIQHPVHNAGRQIP